MEQFQLRWQKTFKIQSYQVDVHRRMNIPSFCNFFQEIAYEHAEHLNFGYHYLKSIGKFWVLSRLLMEVYSYPMWGDEIIITTWPRGMEGMLALRDFSILSAQGEKLAGATTSWLVLDEEKHRPQRIDPVEFSKFLILTDSALNITAPKVAKPEQSTNMETFRVKFSDIDVNQHVNNVRFVQWAIDSIPDHELLTKRVSSCAINFLGEAALGDLLTLWKDEAPNDHYYVTLMNNTKEKELSRIHIALK
jgi:medium-chain acyl-[acyl-carrier-protein] hydrolase